MPTTDVHVKCKTSGKNEVYPYPANSNYYYQCLAGYLLLQQCPQNFHFDQSQGQCISTKPYPYSYSYPYPYRSSHLHVSAYGVDQFTFRIAAEKMFRVFGSILLFLGICLADVFDECNEGNSLSFVTSPKSCAHYIFCNGDESYDGECAEGEYFSADMEMCEPMGDIDCRTGSAVEVDSSTLINSDVETTAPVPTDVITTLAPSVVITLRPSVVNQNGTSNATTISPGIEVIVTNMCPQLDNQSRIALVPNQNSCTDYYICYRGEPLPMSCAASLHFNSRTGKCDHPENVRCLALTSNPREQCKRHVIDVYPHSGNCNYFYQCRSGYLMVQQCPFFYGWDYEKRSCVALSQAKCYNKIQMQMKFK
ncbi:hypothetical protein M5D96_009451 [Drosophila gunungcola]|uniref:Chitin-binding type-2 domain-containing protein n=2 Tax=Drosophila gunungcola TaxID=103775 RepID=A0A9P9YJJ3_9MUSC|nr:hypothetical protein M5D96_009451 [Drosophila gunungcola]